MIRRMILTIIANSVALYLVDYFIANFCFVSAITDSCPEKPEAHILAFIVGGLLLGILNTFVKPILKIISIPITFLTAGLFMFVVNGVVLYLFVWLMQTLAIEGVNVMVVGENSYLTYLYAAIVLGVFNILTHWLVKK